MTAASAPALRIIRLLSDMLGVAFEPVGAPSRMPGFLFDMNIFFQRLLSRFLRDNLTGSTIKEEAAIRNIFAYASDANPRHRSSPAPRPDFALFRGSALGGFMDAKYRDIWERGLPTDWIYQLSIYALASPIRVSVLLYATMNADACDERIEVRQPVHWSNERPASVILRPVPLMRLAGTSRPRPTGDPIHGAAAVGGRNCHFSGTQIYAIDTRRRCPGSLILLRVVCLRGLHHVWPLAVDVSFSDPADHLASCGKGR